MGIFSNDTYPPLPHKQRWTLEARISKFRHYIGWREGELTYLFEKAALFYYGTQIYRKLWILHHCPKDFCPGLSTKRPTFFSIIHLITKRHWPHSIVYTPTNQNIPMNRFLLQSWFKIILLWICAFRLQISQSVQLSKVAIFLSKVHTLCIPSKL